MTSAIELLASNGDESNRLVTSSTTKTVIIMKVKKRFHESVSSKTGYKKQEPKGIRRAIDFFNLVSISNLQSPYSAD